MSWIDSRLELPQNGNKEHSQEDAQPVSLLPPDAEALFETAMEKHLTDLRARKTPEAACVISMELMVTVKGKSVPGPQAVRQRAREYVGTWFTVDTANTFPDIVLTEDIVDAVVYNSHYQLLWELAGLPPAGEKSDGAHFHSLVIKCTIEMREKKTFDDAMQHLTELANTPISFEPSTGDVDELVTPQAAYAEFAGQLRAQGLAETSVFDLVAQLSKLIKQSQEILPSVTQAVVRQLEARVLLSYYKSLEAERTEKEEQTKQKQLAEASLAQTQASPAQTEDISAQLSSLNDISAQLSSLNAVAERQAKDTSTNTFLHLLDGLFGH